LRRWATANIFDSAESIVFSMSSSGEYPSSATSLAVVMSFRSSDFSSTILA
jgi:hypothetical protein